MCEFPHNPPVLCLQGRVTKVQKLSSKSFKCIIQVEVDRFVRPANVYTFSKNLDRIEFKKTKRLKKEFVELYSNDHCKIKEIKTIVEYNCNDRFSDITDFKLLDMNTLKGKVLDPWQAKRSFFNCSQILSNQE